MLAARTRLLHARVQSVLRGVWLDVDEAKMGPAEAVEAGQKMQLAVMPPHGFHFLASRHDAV